MRLTQAQIANVLRDVNETMREQEIYEKESETWRWIVRKFAEKLSIEYLQFDRDKFYAMCEWKPEDIIKLIKF